ncbi:formate acetyltransferase [Bifidobacterium sp. GSD1FS]|uniref:Formate acetyltransferase n=1 Tax=Bifidobacterium canis TaxID=2610880 RepID=A0A7K1J315_9BIFI|nr:formate acetyltransferase [Bifidobacterium canis]
MAAIENATELSPEAIKEKAWEGFVPGNWEKTLTFVTSFRRTTRHTKEMSPSSQTPLRRRSICGSILTTTTSL